MRKNNLTDLIDLLNAGHAPKTAMSIPLTLLDNDVPQDKITRELMSSVYKAMGDIIAEVIYGNAYVPVEMLSKMGEERRRKVEMEQGAELQNLGQRLSETGSHDVEEFYREV